MDATSGANALIVNNSRFRRSEVIINFCINEAKRAALWAARFLFYKSASDQLLSSCFVKLGFHGGVVARKFFDAEGFRFVVGQS